jgi:hypothetical protein
MGFLGAILKSRRGKVGESEPGHVRSRIERLCGELGWPIAKEDRDEVCLHFKDPCVSARLLWVRTCYPAIAHIRVYSCAHLPGIRVPPQVIGYLLRRNDEIVIGAWSVRVDDDCNVSFSLIYDALAEGLDAPLFGEICEQLVNEVVDFDGKLRLAKLLP